MQTVLLQRVLTALVLIPVVVWAVLGLDTRAFAAGLLLVTALGAWEWSRLAGLKTLVGRGLYTVALLAATVTVGWLHLYRGYDALPWLYPAVAFWLWALWVVVRFPRPLPLGNRGWFVGLMGIPVLLLSWLAAVLLHGVGEHGPSWVLALLILIWTADSAAYFAGRRWGRRKLAPAVSPGKSWEGLWGAVVVVLLMVGAAAAWFGDSLAVTAVLLVLGLVTTLVSVLGDLFESVLKRTRGVKDSGSLLPGHGGILDRIDSFTAAAPVFALAILLWLPEGRLG